MKLLESKKRFFSLKLILFLVLLMPVCYAGVGHMPLLAIRQTDYGYEGSPADLYLEIKPGTGRVFIETFPLTKLDTQISTRFAREIACKYVNADCDNYDFFYTIRAESSIIGGPSAGSAISALTIAMLDNLNIDEAITITGTINSGGIVGPVGGLKEKIDAASEIEIKKVLIPAGTRFSKEKDNKTIDLVEYGNEKNIIVVEVSDIDDILYEFTGKKKETITETPKISDEYAGIMRILAERLCNKSHELKKEFENLKKQELSEELIKIEENAKNFTEKGEAAFNKNTFYSAASFCFGANTKYKQLIFLMQDMKKKDVADKIKLTRDEIKDFDSGLPFKYETITDLQTYAIVKERLIEAEYYLELSEEQLGKGEMNESISSLAYAVERFYSAKAWSEFFNNKGKKFDFNKEVLRRSCMTKILEAEERYQYVMLFFPEVLADTKKEIDLAYSDMENEDYELCLFKASKAKAESDIILSTLGVEEEHIEGLLNKKLEIVEKNIVETSKKGLFPIIGYSYYEYAKSLKQDDKYSALLYAEYALELSNLDIYFDNNKKTPLFYIDKRFFSALMLGMFIGLLLGLLLFRRKREKGLFIKINR
ncbi:MAG: hypothetical protein KJ968_05105 [Nanoarchaeota archaeon]|nr:hypothetical protein [Nanoarchaeota archaeon]